MSGPTKMTEEGGFCLGCLLLHEAEVLEESEELLSGGGFPENMKDNHLAGTQILFTMATL